MRKRQFNKKTLQKIGKIINKHSGIISVKIIVTEEVKKELEYGSNEFIYYGQE